MDILKNNKIDYIFQYPVKIEGHNLFFDFYIKDYNCFIEYDGEQHFKAVDYFGGKEKFEKQVQYDGLKNKYCKNNNYILIRIKYDCSYEEIENKLS